MLAGAAKFLLLCSIPREAKFVTVLVQNNTGLPNSASISALLTYKSLVSLGHSLCMENMKTRTAEKHSNKNGYQILFGILLKQNSLFWNYSASHTV